MKFLIAACCLVFATLALASPNMPDFVTEYQGNSVRTVVVPITAATPAQCLISYDNSQCTASTIPFSCCTGVGTGTCACSGGATYTGNVRSITLQNASAAGNAFCVQAPATPIPASAQGVKIPAGGALVLNGAARGVNFNCRGDASVNMMAIIESR